MTISLGLSSVLNSDRAIQVNIAIMRAFVQLRKLIASHEKLARKLEELEEKYDEQLSIVFAAIHALIEHDEKPPKKIGFEVGEGGCLPTSAPGGGTSHRSKGKDCNLPEGHRPFALFAPWREIRNCDQQEMRERHQIEGLIFIIRGQRVMLSTHLAELYQVEPRVLVQAVKRNIERFPVDFMFQLTDAEFANLKSQFVISSWGGLRRANPYAFTEQGVAMLSSVLRSKLAVRVNIEIMRAFVRLRTTISTHKELARKLAELEERLEKQDEDITLIFEAIRELMKPPEKPPRKIGFKVREGRTKYKGQNRIEG